MSFESPESSPRRRRRRRTTDTGRRQGAAERLKRRRRGRYMISDGTKTRQGSNRRFTNRVAWVIFAAATAACVVVVLKSPDYSAEDEPSSSSPPTTGPLIAETDKALFAQAVEALDANNMDKAAPLIEDLTSRVPDIPGLTFRRAQLAYGRKQYVQARTLAQESVNREQDLYLSHYLLGVLASQQNDFSTAVTHFEAAYELASWNANILQNWGAALRRLNRPNQAIDKYEAALAQDPNNQLYKVKIELIHIEQGNVEAARTYTQDILSWTPDNPSGLLLRAALLLHDGQYDDAAGVLAGLRASMGVEAIRNLMDDPFFSPYTTRPELAGLLDENAPELPATTDGKLPGMASRPDETPLPK